MNEFWSRVDNVLDRDGLSRKWLSKETGISLNTINSWFNKEDTYPAVDKAFLIAQALGTSVDFLMSGTEYTENQIQGDQMKNLVNYLQKQSRDDLLRIEGVLMHMGLLNAMQHGPEKREKRA